MTHIKKYVNLMKIMIVYNIHYYFHMGQKVNLKKNIRYRNIYSRLLLLPYYE